MDGTELVVRHSFAPNRLRYCGDSDLSRKIPLFVQGHSPQLEQELQAELESFKGLHSYLSLIATENHLNPFDEKVAEAYWIGNELLDKISMDRIQKMFLQRFSRDDFLGKELAEEMASRLSPGLRVHHSFHVFFVHFMTDAVPSTILNLDRCRISWGKVLETRQNRLLVESEPVEFKNEKLAFGKKRELEIEKPFLDSVREGDWVSFHWNTYCMQLSTEQKKNLGFFTQKNLDALNSTK